MPEMIYMLFIVKVLLIYTLAYAYMCTAQGTLDSRNSGRFDRTNRSLPGEGSIAGSTTKKATYCAKLVGAEFLEEFVAEA